MKLTLDGRTVFAGTGDSGFDPARRTLVLIHGAGMDRTVWALQTRSPAFSELNVLAVDLPGHGLSDGAPLASIEAMADWLAGVVDAAGIPSAAVAGHSMGALVALDAAARHGNRFERVAMLGVTFPMRVAPALLQAARDAPEAAAAMVVDWAHARGLGPGPAPGLRMAGAAARLLVSARPGVLHADLAACDAYAAGLERAGSIRAPCLFVVGSRDRMARPGGVEALAAAVGGAETVALDGVGHMMMSEAPREVTTALKTFAGYRR